MNSEQTLNPSMDPKKRHSEYIITGTELPSAGGNLQVEQGKAKQYNRNQFEFSEKKQSVQQKTKQKKKS